MVRTKAQLEELVAALEQKVEILQSEGYPKDNHWYRTALTVGLGVWIPLLSLFMSMISGTLAGHEMWGLAAMGLVIGAAVLGVSLSHLAWAIEDITKSSPYCSWPLAIALDCSIVLCELVHVYAPTELGLGWCCGCVMATVCGFSMLLNVYAFLNHR